MQRLSALLIALMMTLSCATRNPGDPLTPGYNTYSKEQDIQIGQQSAAEIRKQVDVVGNPQLQNYVKEIGQRLAQQPEAEDYPYEFTLINEPSINAFALPGGPIFVHSGLIEATENEAQLAVLRDIGLESVQGNLLGSPQSREAFAGFPEIPLMEDIAFSKAMKQHSPPACLRSRVLTSGRRWESHGVLRTIVLMWRLRLLYWLGAAPERLARRYEA